MKLTGARRVLVIFLTVLFFFSLAANVYIDLDYAYTMPGAPQPKTGRVYRITVDHGSVVFVNKQELAWANFVFHDLFNVATVCFILIFVLTVDFREVLQRARVTQRPPDSSA